MSYCRWSSMDWTCDLYVYKSNDGIEIHIAKNRRIGNLPKITAKLSDTTKYLQQYEKQMEALKTEKLEPINLKYAGESFCFDKEDAISFLKELKEIGYIFPEYLIDSIKEDKR